MPDISLIAMIGAAPQSGIVCSAYKASRFGSTPVAFDTPVPGGAPDAVATSGEAFGSRGAVVLAVPTFEGYWISMPSGGHIGWVESPTPLIPESDVTALLGDLALKAPLASPAFTGIVTSPVANIASAAFAGKPWFDATHPAFGAIGDGTTHLLSERFSTLAAAQAVYPFVTALTQSIDYAGMQAALTAAFNAPGGVMVLPIGRYKSTDTLVTPANTPGAVTVMGLGRPHSFLSGVNGDPTASGGVTIEYSGNTGDIFLATTTVGNARQYITIEGVTFLGNPAGASGHGLHFVANGTNAILPCLRDVTVVGCKQTGILLDGNIMESAWYNVRSSANGDRGVKAVFNSGEFPGEVRIYGASLNGNLVGLDWNGGTFSAFGLTASNNTNEGILATGNGVFTIISLQLEANGTLAGNQATFTSVYTQLKGINMTVNSGATGNGLSFVNCNWPKVEQYAANSSVAGAGYKDVRFDNGTSRGTIAEYASDDFADRLALGGYGGHIVRRGSEWSTSQPRTQQTVSVVATGGVTPDATAYDELLVTATTAAITITINAPTMNIAFHKGQQMVVEVFNNTAGAITTAWNATYKLNGAWVDPGAGETRRILFSYNATRTAWYEVARTLFDASGNLPVPGNITATSGQVKSLGATASLTFQNRTDLATNWQWYNTGNIARLFNSASDVLTVGPSGEVSAAGQMYPGPEARGATQALGGILHSVGVPSNANGNNNDWCISDNGHTYFKTGGVWVQQATDSLLAHLAGAETITGVKTFTANPVFNAAAIPGTAVTLGTAIAAASAGINSTETQVVGLTLPANSTHVGTTYRITASGVCTSSAANVGHFRARIGTTTLTGNIAVDVSPTAAASGTAVPFLVDILVTVRTSGASGSVIGSGNLDNNGVTGVSAAATVVAQSTATVVLDTTASKILELTFQAAAATTTCTFHDAAITPIVN